jgi:1,4-dihydroxy-2-naphthoate octaprenyltransferase
VSATPVPSPLAVWFLATRPKTLVAGCVPVFVGSALAWRIGHFALVPALASLVGALLIQIGTNLANDYFDFRRGADTADRLGPARVTQQGWLSPSAVLRGSVVSFGLALVVGVYLVWVAGPVVVAIGLTSIVAGYAYTGGPYPLAYHGLGDVFVLVFFGLVAVGGTFFVQTGTVSALVLVASLPVGLLGVALLAVNNTRDVQTDAAAGKNTLVVRWGTGFGKAEYVACLTVSALVPLALWGAGWTSPWVMVSWLSFPMAVAPLRTLMRHRGKELNEALAGTAKLQLVFGLLFALGLTP